MHYEKDFQYGRKQESAIFDILKGKLDAAVELCIEKYSKFDYHSAKNNIELKSRYNKMRKYPTTMITANKAHVEEGKETLFVFAFKDKVAYIKYEKGVFDTFEKRPFSRESMPDDEKDHFFIPVDKLTVLHEF